MTVPNTMSTEWRRSHGTSRPAPPLSRIPVTLGGAAVTGGAASQGRGVRPCTLVSANLLDPP